MKEGEGRRGRGEGEGRGGHPHTQRGMQASSIMWSNRQKMHDADAERARGPTSQDRQHLPPRASPAAHRRGYGECPPGARVDAVGGSPGDRVGGAVSVLTNSRREKHTEPALFRVRFSVPPADPAAAVR